MVCKFTIMELSMVCKFTIMELSMVCKFTIIEFSMVCKLNKRTAVVWSKPKDNINARLFFSNLNLPIVFSVGEQK